MLCMSSQEPASIGVRPDGRPLRVGIVCPYSFETPGGVQNHIRDFSEALMRRGHHVSVFAPGRRTKDMPLWVQTNGSSFAIPYNGSWAHLSYFLAAGLQTRRWVRQGQFDIVHLHEPEAPSVSHKPLVMRGAPPMVATFHASIEPYPRALHLFQRYLHSYLEPLSEAIFVSPSAQRTADHYLPASISRHVIPNGIDRASYLRARPDERWRGTPKHPTIGFLGRLEEERKGFPIFIEAASRVLERHPGARFLVVGDGGDEAAKAIAERDGGAALLERFEFLGRVDDDAKARFYKSLDVYVAPQTGGESFGIVLAEAMAAGCPIVASDLPAFVDVTEQGRDAALFANRDAADCAERICELLADPSLRTRLGKAGLRRSGDFDWETVVDEVLAVYRRALSAQPGTLS